MTHLGKYWASTPNEVANPFENKLKINDCHRIDIAGVASSILATPTIESLGSLRVSKAFYVLADAGWRFVGSLP